MISSLLLIFCHPFIPESRRTFLVTTLDLPSELISFYDSIKFFLPPPSLICTFFFPATYSLPRELTTTTDAMKRSKGIFFDVTVWRFCLDFILGCAWGDIIRRRRKGLKITIFLGVKLLWQQEYFGYICELIFCRSFLLLTADVLLLLHNFHHCRTLCIDESWISNENFPASCFHF